MPAIAREQRAAEHTSDSGFMTVNIALIMAAAFFYMAGIMMGTTLIVGYSHSLGADGTFTGLIAGTMNIMSLLCRPWAGRLSDRAPLRRLAMAAIVLLIVANAGYACSVNAMSILAARIVNGIGFSCLSVCLAAWLTALIPLEHIGKGMGYYGMVNALAMALGPAVGIRLRSAFGYHVTFAVVAAAMIVAFVLVSFAHDDTARRNAAATATTGSTITPSTASSRSTGIVLRGLVEQTISVRVIPVAAVFMLFSIPYYATQSYIVTYVDARRLPVDVGLFFPLYAVALLVLRVAMRNLFDRRSFRWFLWLCAACMIIALGSLAVMRSNGVMFVAAAFMAASYGIMSSVSQSTAARLAGAGHGGRGNGTYYIGLDLGMALGPIIGGFLYARVDAAWFYPLLMIAVPVAIIVYLVAEYARGRR